MDLGPGERDALPVVPGLVVPGDELEVRTSRSSGPGGQGVNTTSSRVELRWDVRRSRVLSPEQRRRLEERLGHRLTQDGVLVLHASEHRSQHRNRAAARDRLRELVATALEPERPRHATRPTRASVLRRLTGKRERGRTKALRRRPDHEA